MKLKIYIVGGFLVLTLSACGANKNNSSCESLLPAGIDPDRDTTLDLTIPAHINSFKLDEVIALAVDNYADTEIELAPDRDLKVYLWVYDSWSLVENDVDFLSAINRIPAKSSEYPGMTTIPIALNLQKQNNPVRICITLEGVKDPDGSRIEVAADTEVVLNP